jgi:ketosteroid isomerase-like protein
VSERDAEAEIRALFAAYGAGFDDADADAVTELFAWPATIWQFGEGHVFEDAEELAENVDALMDVFDEAGIVVTIPDVREVRVVGAAAFASVAWRQENEAGEPLHEFTCHYMLVEQDGEWRIATVVNEAETEEGEPE